MVIFGYQRAQRTGNARYDMLRNMVHVAGLNQTKILCVYRKHSSKYAAAVEGAEHRISRSRTYRCLPVFYS